MSSVSDTDWIANGLIRRAPLSTREKPLNSESTRTPAGTLANERVSTYSRGHTLTASRTAEKTATSAICHSRMRVPVEMPPRSS